MRPAASFVFVLLVCFSLSDPLTIPAQSPGQLTAVAPDLFPGLYEWQDTCNVYVIREGDAGILIDLGDGSVLDHLGEIGVKRVEWVLFTHHHREQCQGAARLRGSETKIAVPQAERALFENPASFRKMKATLGDVFTVHGASFVRPPAEPIPVDKDFSSMDTFSWRGLEFWCVDTRGNSPGGMSYILKHQGKWFGFSGDVVLADARMHNWFDTEWDYGFAAGIYALNNSAALLERFGCELLLPSHGPVIPKPEGMLHNYQEKLQRLENCLIRGYRFNTFGAADQDRVSRPTDIPYLWRVTPHIYKFKGPNFFPNFNIILSDSGHGLVVDCGLLDEAFLDRTLGLMRERLGLKQVDGLIVSHMHGDHVLEGPHLREKWGAGIWALDRMQGPLEHPERFDYAAQVQTYGKGFDSVHLDRLFKPGERLEWEGYHLQVDWMPGQTEFALGLQGIIDGKQVVFTGDNIFADSHDPKQNGHEAVVARNSAILDEGYILGADYLKQLKPDLIIGGHSFVMDQPAGLIERYGEWARRMQSAFQALSTDPDYRYWFDPYWVRIEPYRVKLRRGEAQEVQVHVRNFRCRAQEHLIVPHVTPGLSTQPVRLQGSVGDSERHAFPVQIKAAPDATPGVRVLPVDVTLDGHRYGELFDCIVEITE